MKHATARLVVARRVCTSLIENSHAKLHTSEDEAEESQSAFPSDRISFARVLAFSMSQVSFCLQMR